MISNNDTTFVNGLIEESIDSQVYQDIQRTFARETVSFLNHGNLSITDANNKLINRVEFTECEISPFHKHDIDCDKTTPLFFERKPSKNKFSEKKVAFETIQNFLLSTYSTNKEGRRPYPSAGGLYPVEPLVFLFKDKIYDYGNHRSGCYHFRANSKKLQFLKHLDCSNFYNKILQGYVGQDMKHWPSFCVLYIAHIGKAIFKYRYRGYRHASMEAGSMYQHATLVAHHLDLRTTVWSTFSEPQILYELSLDHGTYMPLTMQLFGYEA